MNTFGNEEWNSQGTATGAAVVQTMQNLAHSLDSTRECTAAINGAYGETGVFSILDVKGGNYNFERMDAYRAAHPTAALAWNGTN